MPATTTASTLKVKPVETVYEVRGRDLLRAINASGMTQASVSKACGYTSGARICRMVKSQKTRIGGDALQRIVRVLQRNGVRTDGLV